MAGFLDFISSGSVPPTVTSETNNIGNSPLWYSQYVASLINRSNAIAAEPAQIYGGQRLAGFTQPQQAAQQYGQQNATAWQPLLADAGAATARGSAAFDPSQLNQFMSPYTEGVVNEIERQGMRNFNEKLMPALRDEFVGSGQFGSTRHMDFAGRAARDTNESILGQSALARQGAFTAGMNNYDQWQDRALQGGTALGALAKDRQALDIGTMGGLSAIGQEQQALDQRNLDLGYEDFQYQRNYPRQTADWLNAVMRGNAPPPSSTITTTGPYQGTMGPSPLAQLVGLYNYNRGTQPTQQPPR